MKKIIAVLCVTALLSSTFAFADVKVPFQPTPKTSQVQGLKTPERVDQHRANMAKIIGLYAPELLSEFEGKWEAIDVARNELGAIKEALKALKASELKAKIDAIRADLKAGTITKEAALLKIQALKDAAKALREVVRSDIDALRLEYGITQGQAKVIHQALKAALLEKDEAKILEILNQLLALLEQRIPFIQEKISYFSKL